MRDKNRQQDLYEGIRPTKSDYLTTGHWIAYGSIILIVVSVLGYLWQRNVGSNLERDLALNSGRREFAELVNLNNILTECEGHVASIKSLEAERDLYDEDSEAWRLANVGVQGVKTTLSQCPGKIQSILDTTEVENVPEFEGARDRIIKLNNSL